MKFLVKIDRATIKENPNAGRRTSLWVAGKTTRNEDGSWHRDVRQIHLMQPVPRYSYSYVDTQVQCKFCDATFDWQELNDDIVYDDEGGETFLDNICPKCGESYCCDVEMEKLED